VKIRLAACLFLLTVPVWARSHSHPAKQENPSDPGYVFALAAANHFLHAWQTGDVENGMVLLGDHVRHLQNADKVEQFFRTGPTGPSRSRAVMDIPGATVFRSCWSRFEVPTLRVNFPK
jgi:hypothetical protein